MYQLKCESCGILFSGCKNKKYCSHFCKNESRRSRRNLRNKKTIEEKRKKEYNKKYYFKTKYVLTDKFFIEQENKKIKELEYSKMWKNNNKIKNVEYRRKTRIKIRGWFDEYKKTLKCENCGYNKCQESLDFHHKDSNKKEFSIGQALFRYSKNKIMEEIKKCIILCANCHRELHYNEKQDEIKKQKEDYSKLVNKPKKTIYSIVENLMQTEWFKEVEEKAKYNLNVFGGNQYTTIINNGISEKIDIKNILSQKVGIGAKTISNIIQIYKRGTEEQKDRARTGKNSIFRIYKELSPIRFTKGQLNEKI